jgi:hydrogenase/urease accessory protein HupE
MSRAARLALALLILAPLDAATAGGARDFHGGLLHPLLAPAHALAVLGTGLLIGQQVPHWRWPAPASYVAGLGVGFAGLIAAFAPTLAAEALLAATAASGALVALARPLPEFLGCVLALATGVALALDSSPGGISVPEANVVVLGTFCGAVILLLAVVQLTTMACRPSHKLGVRVLGSWIAASAIMVLALRLAR